MAYVLIVENGIKGAKVKGNGERLSMTIDEAIAKYKEITNADANCPIHCMRSCDKCVQESKQLAEWLELLKWYEQGMEDIPSESGVLPKDVYHAGYNKAIDEVICKVEEHKTKGYVTGITNSPFEFGACQMADDIVKILEQLKRSLG